MVFSEPEGDGPSHSHSREIEDIPSLHICTCVQCRAKKSTKNKRLKKYLRRLTSKWRRQKNLKHKSLYRS